ncbi:MAG TPA: hypothetical protein VEM32_01240, partial [Geobacteraceae bacterium]|nr:hypothetical protein [Geobacteraceae bacterium]
MFDQAAPFALVFKFARRCVFGIYAVSRTDSPGTAAREVSWAAKPVTSPLSLITACPFHTDAVSRPAGRCSQYDRMSGRACEASSSVSNGTT